MPRSPLPAHSVSPQGMATTPPSRVRQQLPLQRLPAARQQALHPTSTIFEGHSTVCPATLCRRIEVNGCLCGWQLLSSVHKHCVRPPLPPNGARLPGEREDWDAMRQNTASVCSKPYLFMPGRWCTC